MGISAILHNQCYVDTNQHYEKTLYRGKRMVEPQGGQHTTSRLRTVVECTSKRRHPLLGRGSSFFRESVSGKIKSRFLRFWPLFVYRPLPQRLESCSRRFGFGTKDCFQVCGSRPIVLGVRKVRVVFRFRCAPTTSQCLVQ